MQRGAVYQHHGSWWLRYYDFRFVDGAPAKKAAYVKLAPVDEDHPNKRSVLLLAEKHLSPINNKIVSPEAAMSVAQFMENVYFPAAKLRLRPSTYKEYDWIFNQRLKSFLTDIRLRDFRTKHGQQIMHSLPGITHVRLLRIKATLSAGFTHAIRVGLIDGPNPMHGVSVPGRMKKFRGAKYSTAEIERLLIAIGEPKKDATAAQQAQHTKDVAVAKLAVGLAAFCGFRLSEIRGLRWSDFDGESLKVQRSVWRSYVTAPKTEDSEGMVPVLPILQKALVAYRQQTKFAGEHDYILAGQRRGAPLNLHNLEKRILRPAMDAYNAKPENSNPAFQIHWKGWHAFRRGLASNLYELGVQPKVIQAILRHSDIGTTLAYYVQTAPEQSREALEQIEAAFPFGL